MNPPDGNRSVTVVGHAAIRRALLGGLLLIFALWVVTATLLVEAFGRAESRTAALNARLEKADTLLATVRTQMLLASVLLRDLLQGTDAESAAPALPASRRRVEQALGDYQGLVESPAEQEAFAQLRREIDDYWRLAWPDLAWDAGRRATDAQGVLRRIFIPKRELIFQVSESVQALNRAEFGRQALETARLYRAAEQRVAAVGGFALLLTGIAAGLLWRHASRLEGHLRAQQRHDAQTARDLQRLSARLVYVQEQERRAVARELHDEVGQALTAMKMALAHAEHTAAAGGSLEDARAIADRTLQTVRDLTRLLHPRMLDELGLVAALDTLVRDWARTSGTRVTFEHDDVNRRATPSVEMAAYRIVQEALTNVARHAAATRCDVRLERLPNAIRIAVQDDGRGVDPGAAAGGAGVGLLGIQDRVAACGGQWSLDTAAGRGTRLVVELPFAAGELRTEAEVSR